MITVPSSSEHGHPSYGTCIAVWAVLVILVLALVGLSHLGHGGAVWGLLTVTPVMAALVFYFLMHLRYEGPLLKGVLLVALATLLIFFALMFSDVAFR